MRLGPSTIQGFSLPAVNINHQCQLPLLKYAHLREPNPRRDLRNRKWETAKAGACEYNCDSLPEPIDQEPGYRLDGEDDVDHSPKKPQLVMLVTMPILLVMSRRN